MAPSPPPFRRSPLVWISGMTLAFLLWCWHDSWQYFTKGVLLDDSFTSRFVTSSGGRLAFWKVELDPKAEFHRLTASSGRERYTGLLWEDLRNDMPLSSWPPVHWKSAPEGSFFRVRIYSVSWGFVTFLHLVFSGGLIYAGRRRIRKAMQGEGP